MEVKEKTRVLDYSYIKDWKTHMTEVIRFQYGEDKISDEKIDAYLNNIIEKKLKNRQMLLVNNYTHKMSKLSELDLIDTIRKNNLICTGGGCLFLQHEAKRNILIEFILYIMGMRKAAKKKRATFEKGTDEWADADRAQLSFKLIINSLYGCMGYAGFIMFNIFLAEAITNQGRHIITTAINAIENFIGNNCFFTTESEVYTFINRVHKEVKTKIGGKLSDKALKEFERNMDLNALPKMIVDRLIGQCRFDFDMNFKNRLSAIFNNMSTSELIIMYFKNNFIEFNKLDFIKYKIKELIKMNGPLKFCEDYCYKDDDCRALVNDLWQFYDLFVLYDYPIYDRFRKAAYTDKTTSLYTDTDSVFVSLDKFVKLVMEDIFKDDLSESGMEKEDLVFTSANMMLTFANRMIDRSMKTLCYSMNVTPEYAKLLNMKNEFFFSKIMFTDVKKRYVSLAMLQEGQVLGGGKGLPEIKGFDFKKSGTKPFVRDYYTNLCLDDILYAENVNPVKIFANVMNLKGTMEREIKEGSMEFFRQANVKKPQFYKNPYSTQGVNAIMLWNALMPDKFIEFPSDVNLVPIKDLTLPTQPKSTDGSPVRIVKSSKVIDWYRENYPEAYSRLNKEIYNSVNPLIAHMTLSTIAIPKKLDYELPNFITDLYQTDDIISHNMSLILPILKCLGIKSYQVSTTDEYISNMVEF